MSKLFNNIYIAKVKKCGCRLIQQHTTICSIDTIPSITGWNITGCYVTPRSLQFKSSIMDRAEPIRRIWDTCQ